MEHFREAENLYYHEEHYIIVHSGVGKPHTMLLAIMMQLTWKFVGEITNVAMNGQGT